MNQSRMNVPPPFALFALSLFLAMPTSSVFGSVNSQSKPLSPSLIKSLGKPVSEKEMSIEADIRFFRENKRTEFRELTLQWKRRYGDRSLQELSRIAKAKRLPDQDRFIAILSIAHLHPKEAPTQIRPYFKQKSWMLKSAALQSAVLLGNKTFQLEVISMLKDPALVIRAEAAESLGKLRWMEGKDALISAIYAPENYRPANFKKGRADWVPQKALSALRDMKVTGVSRALLPLVNEAGDPRLRAHALYTLEKLENKEFAPTGTFLEKRVAWNKFLLSDSLKSTQGSVANEKSASKK